MNESHFATFVPKTLLYISTENKNACNKVVIELSWSAAARSFDFEITRTISDLLTRGAKLLNADWLRQRAFFLNHEGTFGN